MSTTTKKTAAKKAPAKKTASSRSGNPAKRAAAAQVSDVSAFKKRAQGMVLPLPSGLVVKAKRVELQTFLRHGEVPNPLMTIINDALTKGEGMDVEAMVTTDEEKVDMEMVNEMYEMVNKVVVASLVDPKVLPLPEDEEDRDDDLLYVDEIDDEDKMFLWQWALGGTGDVETFRLQAGADMDALAEIQSRGGSAKPADRLAKR
jgi:hypothetical protein